MILHWSDVWRLGGDLPCWTLAEWQAASAKTRAFGTAVEATRALADAGWEAAGGRWSLRTRTVKVFAEVRPRTDGWTVMPVRVENPPAEERS